MKTIVIQYDEKQKRVAWDDCVQAMVKMLRDFGYPSVSKQEVENQINAILQKKKLNVIGVMMQNYIVIGQEAGDRIE